MLLGSDELGRDIVTRLLHGGRTSLLVGISAPLIGVTLGTILGIASAHYGRLVRPAVAATGGHVAGFARPRSGDGDYGRVRLHYLCGYHRPGRKCGGGYVADCALARAHVDSNAVRRRGPRDRCLQLGNHT